MDQEYIHVLLVEDNPTDALLLQEFMVEAGSARFSLTLVERLATGLEQLAGGGIDVTLLDLSLPDSQGMETLLRLRAVAPEMPVVVLTGLNDDALGVQVIQAGAEDYLVKEQVSSQILLRSVRYAIERKGAREELRTRARQQAAVAELGQRALAGSEQAVLLDEAADLVARTLGVVYSQILELLPDRDTLCLRAGAGWPAGLVGQMTLAARIDSPVGYTLLSSEPVIVEDFRTETRFKKEVAWLLEHEVVSGICVVIEGHAWPYGILSVYTRRQRRFTEDDIHFLQAIANVLAASIKHQRTETALQSSIQKLEIAYRQATIYAQELTEEVMERKQAQEALERLHRHNELILNAAGEGIYGINVDGQVTFVNPAAVRMLGWEANEFIGQPAHDLMHHTTPDGAPYPERECPIYAALKDGTVHFIDNELFWTRQGSSFPVEYISTPIEEDGRLMGAVVVFKDITERKLAQEALADERASLARRVAERTAELSTANAELARAARLKDEFLANMSHELRTPLNAILGLSEALLQQNAGPLNERQLNALRTVEESGRHLLALINDILDVSKIEAGKLELQPGPVSISEICQASLQFVRQAALRKRIDISFPTDQIPPTIQADARRLKQILVNLLSNAVKFTPEGGRVGLEVTAEPDQDIIHFTVWDTGIGITTAGLAKLFKPFVQLDSSLSRHYEGTGLGLVLVSRLAELHQGSVSVESDGLPGRGSRFTVSLPGPGRNKDPKQLDPIEAGPDPNPPSIAAKSGARHLLRVEPALILVAEDNEANIRFMTECLTDEGYRIVAARNGWEAIERIKEERPALVLMDIQMPGLDGLEVTRRMRAEAQLADLPIIALTALAMPGDRERCLAAGANDYMSKPFRMNQLVNLIETYLNPARG